MKRKCRTSAAGGGTDRMASVKRIAVVAAVVLLLSMAVVGAASAYTVTYDGNGSSNNLSPMTQTGDKITLVGNDVYMQKNGFYFAGWNTKADGTGITYYPGEVVTVDLTLYAKWVSTSTTHSVTLPNTEHMTYTGEWVGSMYTGKSSGSTMYGVREGAIVTITATGDGYCVKGGDSGWGGYSGSEELVSKTHNVYSFTMGSTDVTVTATESIVSNTFKVTYDKNEASGGSIPEDSILYVSGDAALVLGNTGDLVKDGNVFFKGWSTSPAGDMIYKPGESCPVNGNVTLYAQWETGYTEMEYLESTGTGFGKSGGEPTSDGCYINTGKSIDGKTVYTKFQLLETSSDQSIFGQGWWTQGGTEDYFYTWYNGGWYYGRGTQAQGNFSYGTYGEVYTLVYNDGNGKISVQYDGGTEKKVDAYIGDANRYSGECMIFGRLNVADFNRMPTLSHAKIWYFKAVDKETGGTYMNFIPCKNSSGTAGMYDTVDGLFYTNINPLNTGGFEEGYYPVTYDGNGAESGWAPVDRTQYASGATVTVKGNTGNMAKTGYTFAGWTCDKNISLVSGGSIAAGEPVPAGTEFMITENVTMSAKWTDNTKYYVYIPSGVTLQSTPVEGTYKIKILTSGPADGKSVILRYSGSAHAEGSTKNVVLSGDTSEKMSYTVTLPDSSTDIQTNTVIISVPTSSAAGTEVPVVLTYSGVNSTGKKAGSYSDTLTFAVSVGIPVTSVTLNKETTMIAKGGNETLFATVLPDTATDKTVTWSSDHPEYATVDSDGTVHGVAAGTAVITATANDGTCISGSCTVTVYELPAGYTLVEYLEGTGTQFIYFKYAVTEGSVEVEFAPLVYTYKGGYSGIMGINGAPQMGWSEGYWNCGNATSNVPYEPVLGTKYTYKWYGNNGEDSDYGFYIDGEYAGLSRGSSLTMKLFWTYNSSQPAICYGVRVYDINEELIHAYVPCRNSNNELGMYDIISDEFFDNDGTGEFTVAESNLELTGGTWTLDGIPVTSVSVPIGSIITVIDHTVTFTNGGITVAVLENSEAIGLLKIGSTCNMRDVESGSTQVEILDTKLKAYYDAAYTVVEYIESTGTQYIVTGFTPDQDTAIEVYGNFTSATSEGKSLFGVNPYLTLTSSAGYNLKFRWNNNNYEYNYTNIPNTYKFDKNEVYVNGNLYHSYDKATWKSSYDILLFGRSSASGGVEELSASRIYSCKICDDGEIVRNFIPAKRNSDGKLGLYETVKGVFYENDGTGDFTT